MLMDGIGIGGNCFLYCKVEINAEVTSFRWIMLIIRGPGEQVPR